MSIILFKLVKLKGFIRFIRMKKVMLIDTSIHKLVEKNVKDDYYLFKVMFILG